MTLHYILEERHVLQALMSHRDEEQLLDDAMGYSIVGGEYKYNIVDELIATAPLASLKRTGDMI